MLAGPLAVNAQEQAPTTSDVARLSDEEVRRLLLERLIEEQAEDRAAPFNPARTAFAVQQELGRAQARAAEIGASLPALAALPGEAWRRMMHGRSGGDVAMLVAVLALALAAGVAADRWLARRLAVFVPEPPPLEHPPVGTRASAGLVLLVIELARLATFVIAASLVFFLLGSEDGRDRTAFVFYLGAAAIVKLVAAGARAYLAPRHPGARIPSYEDHEARLVYNATLRTTAFGAFGFFTCALIATLGLSGDAHTLLLMIVGTLTTVLLTQAMWEARETMGRDIARERDDPGRVRRTVAAIWPNLLVALVPLIWLGLVGAALIGLQPLFGAALWTVLLLVLLPSVDAALWRQTRIDAHLDRPARAAGMRVARLGLVVLAFLSLAAAWRIDLWSFASDNIGAGAANALMQILVTLFVAYGAWQVVSIWADRTIAAEDRRRAEEMGDEALEMGEAGGVGHSRLRTLLPLLKRAAQIALGVMVVMIALSAMGVDTGPLLAGAGVVGLAIGFGSQALVRDVVSGFFFLIEDAFRLGEYIDMGEAKGTVEEISVRSLKLRHHRGALNTVPFGAVDIIKNYSRDWAILKFRVRVPFDTDLNMVRKLLKQTGQRMLEIEEIKEDFIQPFKAQGAVDVDDHGFIVQTKFMSKPGRQWTIRRYAFQALQEAFEENGIPWARPQIRVRVDGIEAEGPEARPETRQAAQAAGAAGFVADAPAAE